MIRALLLIGAVAVAAWTFVVYLWYVDASDAIPPNPNDAGAHAARWLIVVMTNAATWAVGMIVIVALVALAYVVLRRRRLSN